MDKVLIIDGLNSVYRACVKFGKPKEKEPKEEPKVPDEIIFTFNFFRNLRPIIEQFQPVKCFFVLEGHPKFRYDLFPSYKENRRIIKEASKQEFNETFLKTLDIILSLIKHLPITLCRAADYEADDTIFTLCKTMSDEDITVLSSDSDFIQLLQQGFVNIKVFNPIKKIFLEAPKENYVCWKVLSGDKSDNIPKLLSPKKVEAALSNPEVFKKFMDIEENRANFNINRQLIEFREIPLEEISMVEGNKNFDLLRDEFMKLDFQSIIYSWEKYINTFDCIKY